MGWNNAYWVGKEERTRHAVEHHLLMEEKYKAEIQHSVSCTTVWDNEKLSASMRSLNAPGAPEVIVENMDTVSALMKHGSDRTVVLNFASFKNPGGAFLFGSSAQEESLCHASTLYEVLSADVLRPYYEWNVRNKSQGLYKNRALWSKDVIFEQGERAVKADVLTVAAPNRMAYIEHIRGASEEINLVALQSRVKFLTTLIKIHECDTAILGAFGCGVFGQDPRVVANMFKDMMADSAIKTVYAVIDKGGHSKEGAYAIFKDVFAEKIKAEQ